MNKAALIITMTLLSGILLSSCRSSEPSINAVTKSDITNEAEVKAETTVNYDPNLPAVDYGGRDFTFFYSDNTLEPSFDVKADELNGEVLNDSIYARNLALDEKYNITIKWDRDDYYEGYGKVTTSINAGENAYDVIINNGVYSLALAAGGYTQQLNDFPYINFEKPYWNANMLAGSSINHKNYFAYSDMNIHALGATPCVLFNKVVAENYQAGNFYAEVNDGNWTFDLMLDHIKSVTSDIDGDGKITQLDNLGFIGNTFVIDCFLSGTGYQTITKDENDMPKLNIASEEYYHIIEAIQSICSYDNGSYICDRYAGVDREQAPMDAFSEDRVLFWIANLKGVERMRNMKSEFGILPIPKLDGNQAEYKIHYQANIGGALNVPVTASDIELVGMVLEDAAYMSMLTIKPAYVDVLLQGKFLRDDESLATLEIMFDSYYSDIGFMTGGSGIEILSNLREIVSGNSTKYVSTIESGISKYETNLEKIRTAFIES